MKKIIVFSLLIAAISVEASAQIERKIDTSKRAKMMQQQAGKKSMLKSMNLTAEQKEQLKADRQANKAAIENIKNDVNLNEDQKQEKIKMLQAAQKEKMKALLTPEQKKQIANNKSSNNANAQKQEKAKKMMGHRKEMNNSLNLSEDQKAKLKEQQAETRTKLANIKNNVSLSEDQKKEEIKSVLQSAKDEQKKFLNKEQQHRMKEIRKQRKRDGKMRKTSMQP